MNVTKKPEAPQILKESTAYFISFMHLKDGIYHPENIALKNPYLFKVFDIYHIKVFEQELVAQGFVKPKIMNYVVLGIERNPVPKKTQES